MEITRTSLRARRDQQVPKQVSQRQTQERGGYGEELKQQLQTIGNVKREAPVITAKRVEAVVSPTEQYTEDAVKTAMEKLKKFIMGQGLGDKQGAPAQTTPTATTGGGGGNQQDFFSALTNDELGLLSTSELVDRDIRNYGNTVPEGSFGSGSLSTIQASPGSAVDTNIARHSVGTSEDQPPTVKFERTKYGQGGLPLGTTTLRQGEKPTGPAVNASSFQQKNVRGSSFNTGKDESARPRQTVASLPSNYKATEKAAFDKAKSYKDSKAKGDAAAKATGTPTKPKAGSFGISAEGKKTAEANKEAKRKEAKKKATKQKTKSKSKSKSTSKSSSKKSNTGSKKSSRGAKGGSSSRGKGGTGKKGGSTGGSKKSSRGAKGGSSSRGKGGTSKGGRRGGVGRGGRRGGRRCDIRCKFDISILTNQNLIRDDLADVAYFVKELQEIN